MLSSSEKGNIKTRNHQLYAMGVRYDRQSIHRYFPRTAVKSRRRKAIEDKRAVYLPMGIKPNEDMTKLQSYYQEGTIPNLVLKADTDTFRWLLTRRGSAHPATPGGTLTLPPVPSSFHIDI